MIENRDRLEKQIFLGRQSVRQAMQIRGGGSDRTGVKIEAMPQERVPTPSTGTKLPTVGSSLLQAPDADESPLPMDTDQEAVMLNDEAETSAGTYQGSGALRHLQDSSRPHAPRRRSSRTSYHRTGSFEGDYGAATPDPPPPPSGSETDRTVAAHHRSLAGLHHPPSLFRRLSKSSIRSAFSSLRRGARASAVALADREAEQTWSEDSSSDDDLELSYFPRRRSAAGHHASALEMHAELVSRQAAVAAAAATSDDDLDLRPQVLDQDG